MFDANKLDGAIVAGMVDNPSEFAVSTMPVVSIERYINDSIPMVSCDKESGGKAAARFLAERGCRRPVVFSHDFSGDAPIAGRDQTFFEECGRLGLDCLRLPIPPREIFNDTYQTMFRDWFAEYPDLDGVFATDEIAVLTREACRELGCKVPEQVQVLGFDGIELSRQFRVSTIAQPIEEMGVLAVDLLLRRIEGEVVASRSILPVKLIERDSTRKL